MKSNFDTGSEWFSVNFDVTHHEGGAASNPPTARSKMVKGWAQHGPCVEADPEAMFVRGAAQNITKQVCVRCPVIVECLADSLDNHTEFGVWGGMTERQRRALLRRRPDVTSWRALFEEERTRLQRRTS